MKGNYLPSGDNIMRHVKPSLVLEDGTIHGLAFHFCHNMRNEKGLSVNWLEAFKLDKSLQLSEVRRCCALHLKLSSNGRFAEINVGTVLSTVNKELKTLRIVHNPIEADNDCESDLSHAEILLDFLQVKLMMLYL